MSKKQDTYYFENFIACAELSTHAAKLLATIMKNFDESKLQNYLDAMHGFENAADMKKHELSETLVKAFITPLDREDLIEVSRELDELIDQVEDVLIRIYYNHVVGIRPDAIELSNVVVKCCEEVLGLMKELANFKRSKSLKDHIIRINSLEGEADRLFMNCMYHLHAECDNVMEVIAWRDIYIYLERCTDTAEHIADIVEGVIMKNS